MNWHKDYYSVPEVRNPIWKDAAQPLLEFIILGNRTIDEILLWSRAKEHSGSMIRHMLAWLSFNNLVHYSPALRIWRLGAEPRDEVTGQTVTPTPDKRPAI